MENEIMDVEENLPAVTQQYAIAQVPTSDGTAVMRMIEKAMSTPDFDVDKMMKLMDMKERFDAAESKKAYTAAMAMFKENPPEIFKDKQVSFGKDGAKTEYMHATIGNVVEKIVAGLARHGFSHRWVPDRSEGGMIRITCVITHKLGHSESTWLEAGLDSSGGKNNIQAMSSTVSYLERYTLLAATGLSTKDQFDDDGRGSAEPAKPSEKTVARPYCTDEKFAKNKGAWRQLILDKTKTVKQLIGFLESKFDLSEAQKLTIDSWSHENDDYVPE